MLEALEDRKLMSLVIDLRVAGGAGDAKEVTVTHVGQTVQLEAWGVVTGQNDVITDEALQTLIGSFLSSAGGAVLGDLAVTAHTPPFNALGTQDGRVQDLDGDGDLDIGTTTGPSNEYFAARSSTMTPGSDPTADGTGAEFKLADLTFTVTAIVDPAATTELTFRPRPGTVSAVWREDDTPKNASLGTFAGGAPVIVTVEQPPPTATISGSVFIDENGNGKRQEDDRAAIGWLVFADVDGDGLHDADEASDLTDADGLFALTVAPGTHTIRVVQQDRYEPSRHLPTSYTITVAADDEIGGVVFGQQPI
jgi:hypothetical protein